MHCNVKKRRFFSLMLLLLLLSSTGCAYLDKDKWPESDPFESVNRKVFYFNTKVDKWVMRPAAKVYKAIVPDPIEDNIGHFFQNVGEFSNFYNHLAQLNFTSALINFWRFSFNSTLGLGGLFDVASHLGLPIQETDLGTTLAVWGFRGGPYVIMPFLGPSNFWNSLGSYMGARYFSLWHYLDWEWEEGLFTLKALDARAQALSYDALMDDAFDPYIFVRNAYQQNRRHKWMKAKRWIRDQYHGRAHPHHALEKDIDSPQYAPLPKGRQMMPDLGDVPYGGAGIQPQGLDKKRFQLPAQDEKKGSTSVQHKTDSGASKSPVKKKHQDIKADETQ